MADLVVIVPSRGRPEAAIELAEAFRATCTAETDLVFAVDEDDLTRAEYAAAADICLGDPSLGHVRVTASKSMVEALNLVAFAMAVPPDPEDVVGQATDANGNTRKLTAYDLGDLLDRPFAIGFMGDDHRPRTVGWDKEFLDALRDLKTGIVYADDLYQGEDLPTQCAMTADIVRALGYMCPPSLQHMYVDNFWLDLGREADCLYYLPDVVIEHMHPIAGKAKWDEGHKRVNDQAVFDSDALAYGEYHQSGRFWADVDKVKALIA